jgi:cytochrome c5
MGVEKGAFMLRFSQAIVVSLLASTFLLACSDKINPRGSKETSGAAGSTGADDGGGIDGATPQAATYSGTIKPLLEKYCTSCHSPTTLDIPPMLNTYGDAKANVAAANDAIRTASMPPSGKTPTDAETKAFQDWVNQGAPNN